jgi:hypothetical protein
LLSLIRLGHGGFEFLFGVRCGMIAPREIDLTDRQETANPINIRFEPALDSLSQSGVDNHTFSERGQVVVDGGASSAQHLNAFLHIETVDDHLDR